MLPSFFPYKVVNWYRPCIVLCRKHRVALDMFALIAAPARRADRSGPMPSRQAARGRGMRRCESAKEQRDEQQKKVTVIGRNRTSIFEMDALHTYRQATRFVTKQHIKEYLHDMFPISIL